MISNNSNSYSNFPYCTMLTMIFIVLKFVGVIDWSWIQVFSPIWIGQLFVIIIFILVSIKCWLDDVWDDMNYKW